MKKPTKLRVHIYLSKISWNWYWHIKAANNRIIATSGEGYVRHEDAIHALHLLFGSSPQALHLQQQIHELRKEVIPVAKKKSKKPCK